MGETSVPKYGVFEMTLTTTASYTNPYTDVSLSATFQGPTTSITLDGYWDGGNLWKVRIAPTEVGRWTLTSVKSNDAQLNHQAEGTTFTCRPATDADMTANETLRHGFVTVNPAYPHTFAYADGTPFFLLGDTPWDRAFKGSLFQDGSFQAIVDRRAAQGFTVFSAAFLGLNGSMGNEGGPPFDGRHTDNHLNPGFFQWVDKRVDYMTRRGVRPMMMIGDPDHGLTSDPDWNIRVQRYLIARYAAFDVVWFMVKENEEWHADATVRALGQAIEEYDPYRHPTSTHTQDSSDEFGGDGWLDFNSLQRGGGLDGAPEHSGIALVVHDYRTFEKPVVQTEAFYRYPSDCPGANWIPRDEVLVDGLWAVQLHGGWNAGYEFVAGCDDDDIADYLANLNHHDFDYQTYLKRFFIQTEFWALAPHNDVVVDGMAWAAAQPGREYVLYLREGGLVTVDLTAAQGALSAAWYNPRTGDVAEGGTVTGGGRVSFTAPDTKSWVLHLNADATPPAYPARIHLPTVIVNPPTAAHP